MTYKIVLKKSFKKQTKDIPDKDYRRIMISISELKNDPLPSGNKKLKGTSDNIYRIRIGDYRIVYEINYADTTIVIIKIGHRSDVYN